MRTILITGGTGMVGHSLTLEALRAGYKVTVLSRSPENMPKEASYANWDPAKGILDKEAVLAADHIIHLAGANLFAQRWTKSFKDELISSRVNSARLIINTLKAHAHNVKTFVSASAIGWYGADKTKNARFKESEPADSDFLGELCQKWEAAAEEAKGAGLRVVSIRTGIVLSKEGGSFKEFSDKAKIGLAPIFWPGTQIISWVHIKDLVKIYLFAIENSNIEGSFNAVADYPVSQKELVLKIGKQVKGNFVMPVYVPGIMLRAILGGAAEELLKSCTVSNDKIQDKGYHFLYPGIDAALNNI